MALDNIRVIAHNTCMDQSELTVEEAARVLGYHPGHIRRLILAGRVTARRIGRRTLVISREDVERLAREGRQRPGRKPRTNQQEGTSG